MTTRAIATPPGKPTQHVTLTPAEETARQAESDTAALDGLRFLRRQEFKVEALRRIAAQVPAWDSFERIEFLLSIANMLNTVNMTAAQSLARDILLYARGTAIPKLAPLSLTDLQSVNPTAADPFGDGTRWPT